MTAVSWRPALPRGLRAVALALPAAVARLRRDPPPERAALVGLLVVAVAGVVGGQAFGPAYVPPGIQVVPLLGGGLLLRRKAMRLLVVVAGCLLYDVLVFGSTSSGRAPWSSCW